MPTMYNTIQTGNGHSALITTACVPISSLPLEATSFPCRLECPGTAGLDPGPCSPGVQDTVRKGQD